MWPTFCPGDRVLVRRVRAGRLRAGQVAVVEQPGDDGDWPAPPRGPVGRRQWVIKRIAAVPGDPRPEACKAAAADRPERLVPAGQLVLFGDNPGWSYDSRQFGYFPARRLLGVVVRRFERNRPGGGRREPGGGSPSPTGGQRIFTSCSRAAFRVSSQVARSLREILRRAV